MKVHVVIMNVAFLIITRIHILLIFAVTKNYTYEYLY